jgi:hypothetical protein
MADQSTLSGYAVPVAPLPSARQCLLVARLIERRPPLCAAVGAACQRVLLQTLCDWSAAAPALARAAARARSTRNADMHAPQ